MTNFNPARAHHRTDPVTSGEAAASAEPFVGEHHKKIMHSLRGWSRFFGGGMTAHEITGTINLEYLQVVRRLSELQRAGKIINTGQTRRNPNGRRASVWSVA